MIFEKEASESPGSKARQVPPSKLSSQVRTRGSIEDAERETKTLDIMLREEGSLVHHGHDDILVEEDKIEADDLERQQGVRNLPIARSLSADRFSSKNGMRRGVGLDDAKDGEARSLSHAGTGRGGSLVLSHHTSFVKRKMVSNVVELRIQGEGFTTSEKQLWWESEWLQDLRFQLFDLVKMNKITFAVISFLVTILIIFLDSFRQLALPPSADTAVDIIFVVMAVYVSVEILYGIWIQDNYFFSLAMLCDVCVLFSLCIILNPLELPAAALELLKLLRCLRLMRLGDVLPIIKIVRKDIERRIEKFSRGLGESARYGSPHSLTQRENKSKTSPEVSLGSEIKSQIIRLSVLVVAVAIILGIFTVEFPFLSGNFSQNLINTHFAAECHIQNSTDPPVYSNDLIFFQTLTLRVGQRHVLSANIAEVNSMYRKSRLVYYPSKKIFDEAISSSSSDYSSSAAHFCVAMVLRTGHWYILSCIVSFLVLFIALLAAFVFQWHTRSMLTVPLLSLMKQRRKMLALLDVFRALHADEDDAIETILSAVQKLIGCDSVLFYYLDDLNNAAVCTMSTRAEHIGHTVKFGEGVVGSVACQSESVLLNNVRQLGSPWSETLDEVPGTETDSLMCMAISDKRREKFAVMLCINKLGTETFTKHDHAVFEAFLSEIAFVLKQQEQRHMYSMIFHNQNQVDVESKKGEGEKRERSGSEASVAMGDIMLGPSEQQRLTELLNMYTKRTLNKTKETNVVRVGGSSFMNFASGEKTGSAIFDTVFKWGYDPYGDSLEKLAKYFGVFMDKLGLEKEFKCPEKACARYARSILNHYRDVPYHNKYHGFSVFQITVHLMKSTMLQNVFSELDLFSTFLAALGHDVDHPGVNNTFLIVTNHPIAVTYNDISPLENHHAATCIRVILKLGEQGPFANMEPSDKKSARKFIIYCILQTDMSKHSQIVSDISKQSSFSAKKEDERLLLASSLMHAADISNPIMPWEVSKSLAERCCVEFVEQVKKERAESVPITTFMDIADDSQMASVNFGFVAYVVLPLWKALSAHFPVFNEFKKAAEDNRYRWEAVRDEVCTLEQVGDLDFDEAIKSRRASMRRGSAMSMGSSKASRSSEKEEGSQRGNEETASDGRSNAGETANDEGKEDVRKAEERNKKLSASSTKEKESSFTSGAPKTRSNPKKPKKRKSASFKISSNDHLLMQMEDVVSSKAKKSVSMHSFMGDKDKPPGSSIWKMIKRTESQRQQLKKLTKEEVRALAKSQFLDMTSVDKQILKVQLGSSPSGKDGTEGSEAKAAATTKAPLEPTPAVGTGSSRPGVAVEEETVVSK